MLRQRSSRWSCIWVSFARLRWRHSLDDGVNQTGRLFKAKKSDRSSRVNEYAVCCHALFLYPAVVLRREGEKHSFRSPAPNTHHHQWCGLYQTYVVSAAQTQSLTFQGHLDFALHQYVQTLCAVTVGRILTNRIVLCMFWTYSLKQAIAIRWKTQASCDFELHWWEVENKWSCHSLSLWNTNQKTVLLITNCLAERFAAFRCNLIKSCSNKSLTSGHELHYHKTPSMWGIH